MAKIAELSSSVDNTVLYPLTKTKAVTNEEGTDLDTLLSDETQARILGDQRLSESLNTEVDARQMGEFNLQNQINAIKPSSNKYEHISVQDETIYVTLINDGG